MDVINYLNDMNIESRPVWKPMHLQPYFMERNANTSRTAKETTQACRTNFSTQGICLPSASAMTDEEQEYVIETVKEAIAR